MPWINNPYNDPSFPYGFVTKQRPYQEQRPRLPPWYFTKGFAFYQDRMNDWMRDLERENKEYWERQSKFNHRKLFKPMQYMGQHRIPIYYDYAQFKRKANKYTLRKLNATRQRIAQNKLRAQIKRRGIIAAQQRKAIVKYGLNKYKI